MNNAIYGKFLQNVMKQSTLKFVNTLLDAIKVQSLPGFVRNVYHNGNFTIADVKHEEVKFDKPIYLGATITELVKLSICTGSTTTMWCHTHWGRDRVQLLMTDADSLMLKVKTKDIWADIKAFNREHENWIEDEGNPRNGQLGVFKSETGKDPSCPL